VKVMEREDHVVVWKCSNCEVLTETNEVLTVEQNDNEENCIEQLNCSSLADEINRSILQENEELKQELHVAKNTSSLYLLEFEDKVKQNEETIESLKKSFDEKEKELLSKIMFLEQKMKKKLMKTSYCC
ncbi:hypothetical protein J6590_107911, partial [Homalodisca vitripennis]